MELTNTAGKVYKFSGSLCSSFEVDGIDLSDLLRDSLKMPELYAFDGNNKPDMVNRSKLSSNYKDQAQSSYFRTRRICCLGLYSVFNCGQRERKY